MAPARRGAGYENLMTGDCRIAGFPSLYFDVDFFKSFQPRPARRDSRARNDICAKPGRGAMVARDIAVL
jgi:hypothetical protein